MDVLDWTAPGPGPWQQDRAHNPAPMSPLMQEIFPLSFARGFEETFAAWGVLLDRMALAVVNGFAYLQPQPFDMPGPDGPKDPEWIGAEIGRRTAIAERAFADKIWREAIRRWDEELKPASMARHAELGGVDLGALDLPALREHLHRCIAHTRDMVYQHHRFNAHALAPVGDFCLQVGGWTGKPPFLLFGAFDGYSPASNVASPEMQPALEALRADAEARDLLTGGGDPEAVLQQVRTRLPAVDEHVSAVSYRLAEGFDVVNPTVGEMPAMMIGKLVAALDVDPEAGHRRADEFVANLRRAVPTEHHAEFDELLAEARLMYRLRDERGLYSDIPAVGLLRRALLEAGRRAHARGAVDEAQDILEAGSAEVDALLDGAALPTGEQLVRRRLERVERAVAGAPPLLGPPPPPPPPVEMLPPPLGRVMSSIGFIIEGILGEREHAGGDANCIIGICGNGGVYEGRVRLVHSLDDLLDVEAGEVLVTPTTGEAFNSMLHLVGAIVTDHGSYASHAAIMAREMGFPAVVGTVDVTSRLRTGAMVRVDGDAGEVTVIG